jgi:hypothetical protein
MPLKPAYTVNEFMASFGVGRTRLYVLINAGAIKARKNGNRTIILGSDAQAFLDALPSVAPKMAA